MATRKSQPPFPQRGADPAVMQRARPASPPTPAAPAAVARARAASAAAPAPLKPARKSGLRALVPSSVRSDGEVHPYVAAYKAKWLSRLDFASDESIESLLLLALLVLALGRLGEAEAVTNTLMRHVDVRRVGARGREAMACVLRLATWLKARRGLDASLLLDRAQQLRHGVFDHDREWLSEHAGREIEDAAQRHRPGAFLPVVAGVARWLNDGAARPRAEAVLQRVLAELQHMMA